MINVLNPRKAWLAIILEVEIGILSRTWMKTPKATVWRTVPKIIKSLRRRIFKTIRLVILPVIRQQKLQRIRNLNVIVYLGEGFLTQRAL